MVKLPVRFLLHHQRAWSYTDTDGYEKIANMHYTFSTFPDASDVSIASPSEVADSEENNVWLHGSFRNKTWIEVLNQHPHDVLLMRKMKNPSDEVRRFVRWVNSNYEIDPKTKRVSVKASEENPWENTELEILHQPDFKCQPICDPDRVNYQGSTASWIQMTCKDCGLKCRKPRSKPFRSSVGCPHLNTDHRGSNAYVHKTYCRDCGTVTECISQTHHKSLTKSVSQLAEDRAAGACRSLSRL